MADGAEARTSVSPAILPLFREIGHLKRIRSAGREGTIAQRLFAGAWAALARGEGAEAVMARTTAAALAATRLGDLDLAGLTGLGLSRDEAAAVLERAFDEVAHVLDAGLAERLRPALADGAPGGERAPAFVALLAAQPRAGVTCPGKPRLMLQPEESHAEHCLGIAVCGVIAAPAQGADPTPVFLSGLAHHLHNAAMPDSGYTGEMLLGDHLEAVMERAREQALDELPEALAARVRAALQPIGSDRTPEARAFHVADVLDRVLEVEHHLRAASTGMDEVLGPYALVHDGPVKPFHDRVLREAGLLT